jgi:hypothetical protein
VAHSAPLPEETINQICPPATISVLGEMILLLIHKAVITESEGRTMLQKLIR